MSLVRLLFSMCWYGCLPHTEHLSAGHSACSSVTPAAGPGKTCLRHGIRIRVTSKRYSMECTGVRVIPSQEKHAHQQDGVL